MPSNISPLLKSLIKDPSWQKALAPFWEEEKMHQLMHFLESEEASGKIIYPPKDKRFAAFEETPYDTLRVVIVGQDPYHGAGQAHGLSFSVPVGVKLPPSLRNIYKEMESDLKILPAGHGCLRAWAKQGVLLLNVTLTVESGSPQSHAGIGWERFTDRVLLACLASPTPLIFVFWGKPAQEKGKKMLEANSTVPHPTHHHVLTAPHPSPFSAHSGFFGCRHFSKINSLLQQEGYPPIHWQLDVSPNNKKND